MPFISAKWGAVWFIWPHYPFPILRCPVSSFPTSLQTNFCMMGKNEWCSHRHSTMHSYPLQFFGSSWNLLGKALVKDLCQLNYSRVPVLLYNSLEMMLSTLLENCAITAVKFSREGLWVLIPTFKNLCYGCLWEPSEVYRLRNRGPCKMGINNKHFFKWWEICVFPHFTSIISESALTPNLY